VRRRFQGQKEKISLPVRTGGGGGGGGGHWTLKKTVVPRTPKGKISSSHGAPWGVSSQDVLRIKNADPDSGGKKCFAVEGVPWDKFSRHGPVKGGGTEPRLIELVGTHQ